MNNYQCWFNFYDAHAEMTRIQWVAVDSIGDVSTGFWITDDGEFTKGRNCAWWIPPSAILVVEKTYG